MSYDGYLQVDTGFEHPVTVIELGNMTSNVAPMWGHALEMAKNEPCRPGCEWAEELARMQREYVERQSRPPRPGGQS